MNISENDIQRIKDAWEKLVDRIREIADQLRELIGEISEKLGLPTSKRYRKCKNNRTSDYGNREYSKNDIRYCRFCEKHTVATICRSSRCETARSGCEH